MWDEEELIEKEMQAVSRDYPFRVPEAIVDVDSLSIPDGIFVLSYGSNSLVQLQGRLKDHLPFLSEQYPCSVPYCCRFFSGETLNGWSTISIGDLQVPSAVASIIFNPHLTSSMVGSVIKMNISQLKKLTHYEGGYTLYKIFNLINLNTDEVIPEALVFIRDRNAWSVPPSISYLVAIYLHLKDAGVIQYCPNGIEICSYIGNSNKDNTIVDYTTDPSTVFRRHGNFIYDVDDLTIEAVFVTVNRDRVVNGQASWEMPKTLHEIVEKLNVIGIRDIFTLRANLSLINDNLLRHGLKTFTPSTVDIIGTILGVQNPNVFQPLLPATSTGPVHVMVYGSLLSSLHNHHLLASHRSNFLGNVHTVEEYYMSTTNGGNFPYLTKNQITHGQRPSPIVGELYLVTVDCLVVLDRLEGHPNWYCREEIDITIVSTSERARAWIYFLHNESSISDIRRSTCAVDGGDWRAYLNNRR